jgi:hypothetical protein
MPPPTVAGTGRSRGRMWLVLAGVAAVAVLGVGAFVLIGGGDGDDDAGPDSTHTTPTTATDSTAPPVTEPDSGGQTTLQRPVDATRAYFAAAAAGDCAYMVDHSTPASWSAEHQSRDRAVAECQDNASDTTRLRGLTLGDVTLVSQDGDHAVVRVDLTLAGQPESLQLPVEHVDGVWLVDVANADASGPGGPG